MKNTTFLTSAFACVAILVACSELPKEAYYTHGQPESLLVTSKRETNFPIYSKESVKNVLHWAGKNKPTEAALNCQEANRFCNKIEQALERNGVATTRVISTSENSVTFSYSHIAARACENRYIDNMINPYNLNHPTYGCSNASNIAQMVADKRQFTNPDVMDNPDAHKAIQTMDAYRTPTQVDTDFQPLSSNEKVETGSSR